LKALRDHADLKI